MASRDVGVGSGIFDYNNTLLSVLSRNRVGRQDVRIVSRDKPSLTARKKKQPLPPCRRQIHAKIVSH